MSVSAVRVRAPHDRGARGPVGDDAALARLIERALDDAAMLPASARQTVALAPHFAPEAEAAALYGLVATLLERHLHGARA